MDLMDDDPDIKARLSIVLTMKKNNPTSMASTGHERLFFEAFEASASHCKTKCDTHSIVILPIDFHISQDG